LTLHLHVQTKSLFAFKQIYITDLIEVGMIMFQAKLAILFFQAEV